MSNNDDKDRWETFCKLYDKLSSKEEMRELFEEEIKCFSLYLSHVNQDYVYNAKVIYKQLDRIQQLIEKMEPTDIRVKHREWYLGNRYLFDKGNYANRWKMLEDKKLSAVKEIFDEYGSEEVC